jgi:uncharacterized phage protein (TIGR02218 family)
VRTDITAQLLAHLQADISTLGICWCIEKHDGTRVLGTDHDKNVTVPTFGSPADDLAGTYLAGANITGSDVTSSTDMSVDNAEAQGAFPEPGNLTVDVTVADIEAGLLDNAPVTLFALNWRDPSIGYVILRRGILGQISRTSDFAYTVELRGLVQYLSQTIIETFSDTCLVVRLGDARCKLDVAAITIDVTAFAVTSRKQFTTSGIPIDTADGYFAAGILRGLTGANTGYEREVKRHTGPALELWDELPADITVGDTFALEPGCDRTALACRTKFPVNNIVNYRGYGIYIPGVLAVLAGPTTG